MRASLKKWIKTVRLFSEDIKMEFGVSKCAVLVMINTNGINLPNQECITALGEEEECKYLAIPEADGIKNDEMKEVTTEYFRRIRKILKSKLNAGNIFQAINSRAVSIIRYRAGIVD